MQISKLKLTHVAKNVPQSFDRKREREKRQ